VTFLELLGFSGRALLGHRLRTFLSLLGVAIGVASVIVLTGLGEGARLYVTGEFASIGSNLVIVFPGRTETTGAMPLFGGVPNDLTVEDIQALEKHVPLVKTAAPIAMGEATARFRDKSRELTVIGTTDAIQTIRQLHVHLGRFLPSADSGHEPRVCVIGTNVQRELFDGRNPLGEILELGEDRFRVIGVLAPRGVSIGMDMDDVVEIPVGRSLQMFNQSGLFRALIEARNHEEIEATADAVRDFLTERHGEEDITVVTQGAILSTFDEILNMLTAALAGIAAVSLSVAGVAIMNVMLVTVSERTSEIGLLKALGVSGRQVVSAFLLEAALMSTAGGLIGLALAWLAIFAFGLLYPNFPVQPPVWAVAAALLTSMGVGLVFGALPARRAALLDPVAALGRG
jgi:putative ABC transport system permease protein